MIIVASIYHHPEFYPPTLNAILNLATIAEKVIVLTRNQMEDDFPYPPNVIIMKTGKQVDVKTSEKKSVAWKLRSFIQFVWANYKIIKKYKPDWVINYDNIPLFATYLVYKTGSKHFRWWYHNHDISELNRQSTLSIGWMATRNEHRAFRYLDIFSLPAEERKIHFPAIQKDSAFFFLPNYPSTIFFKDYYKRKKLEEEVRLIFQGSISGGHGLEEIIKYILPGSISGKKFRLILKGRIPAAYQNELVLLAAASGVKDRLDFFPVTAYKEVPRLASTCNIGIGIHRGTDVMNATLGTSSNKIYEYAGLGLPVLLFNNPHFKKHLEKYSWALFTDCTDESLYQCLDYIIKNYEHLSESAIRDFGKGLNFEYYFKGAMDHIQKSKKKELEKYE